MANETLKLSEHELYFLPPGTPATAPATRVEVEVDGELQTVLARFEWKLQRIESREYYSIFYRVESEDKKIFKFEGAVSKNRDEVSESEKLELINKQIMGPHALLWCSPDATFGISFKKNGLASVTWSDEVVGQVYFEWENEQIREHFYFCPRSAFVSYCQGLLDDKASALNYVLHWRQLTSRQREAIAFGCENGNWEQLRKLFALVQIVITSRLGFFPNEQFSRSRWPFDRDLLYQRETVATVWASRWRDLLCEIMRPSFWGGEPRCHYDWRHSTRNIYLEEFGGRYDDKLCQVRCEMPTAHETLEAQLELRDFLRPHLPDDEIEKLLHPPINQL